MRRDYIFVGVLIIACGVTYILLFAEERTRPTFCKICMSAQLNNKPIPFHLIHDFEYENYLIYPTKKEGCLIAMGGLIVVTIGLLSKK